MDNVQAELEKYEYIIDYLIQNYNFDTIIDNPCRNTIMEWSSKVDTLKGRFGSIYSKYGSLYFYYGTTKFCLYTDNSTYVLKFSFNPYDMGNREVIYDYCKRDVQIYKKACEEGVSSAFAWCDYGFTRKGKRGNIHFYLSEYCVPYTKDMIAALKIREKAASIPSIVIRIGQDYYRYKQLPPSNKLYFSLFYYASTVWGDELALKVEQFIHKYKIQVLYKQNWGLIGNWPVMFDCAGTSGSYFIPVSLYEKLT